MTEARAALVPDLSGCAPTTFNCSSSGHPLHFAPCSVPCMLTWWHLLGHLRSLLCTQTNAENVSVGARPPHPHLHSAGWGLGTSLDLWVLTLLSTPLTRCHFPFRVLVCEAGTLNPQCPVGCKGGGGCMQIFACCSKCLVWQQCEDILNGTVLPCACRGQGRGRESHCCPDRPPLSHVPGGVV